MRLQLALKKSFCSMPCHHLTPTIKVLQTTKISKLGLLSPPRPHHFKSSQRSPQIKSHQSLSPLSPDSSRRHTNPVFFNPVTPNQATINGISKSPQVRFLKVRSSFNHVPVHQLPYQKVLSCKLHDRKMLSSKLHDSVLLSCKLHDRELLSCNLHNSKLLSCKWHDSKLLSYKLHHRKLLYSKLDDSILLSCNFHDRKLLSSNL